MLTCSFSLRAQAPPFIAPAVFDTIVQTDTLSYGQRLDLLSYEQRLDKATRFNSPWMMITRSGLDTSTCQVSLDTWFALPGRLVSGMVRDLQSDTTLAPVNEPLKAGNRQAMFQFGQLKLKWNSRAKAFISEGPLPLLAIGKTAINKQVKGYVMLEVKRSGDVMSIYLENGKGGWYTFQYANGIMLAYTSDEKLNSKIAKHPVKRGKSPGPTYRCALGSRNERVLILKKVERAKDASGM